MVIKHDDNSIGNERDRDAAVLAATAYFNCGLKTVNRWLTKPLWHLNTNANPDTIISTLIVYVQQYKVWIFYSLYKY